MRRYKLHGDEFLRSIDLFTSLKLHMGGKRFSTDDDEMKGKVEKWTKGLAGNYFEEGINKLIPQFTTCIERYGDHIEK